MLKVSKAYRQSMKNALRERAYIMLSFGVINQELQAKATIANGEFTYYTNTRKIFGEKTDDTVYATLEENFTKVDGSMFYLPRRNASGVYYDTGLISDTLISDAVCSLSINFNTVATDFKGITINFGENYPIDFDIVGDTGFRVEFRGNDLSEFTTEEVFEGVTRLTLVFYRMKYVQSRLRIYSIRFGYGLVYYNDSVMESRLENYVSPIGADIPQIDFSVTLKNYDKYFNVDNPRSAINFLETGQEMDIFYGYQLPDSEEIEWMRGNHLLCSEWESDDYTATIRCQDVFRHMDSEYFEGAYTSIGKSYFELATEILRNAGQSDYYIDPRLKGLYTKNPIPRVKHKEALQIIANACRCVLTQSRTGSIRIKSNFNPRAEINSNGEADYSNISNVLRDGEKNEYGNFSTNYTVVDGSMFFLPRTLTGANFNTGYVSKEQSNADGKFQTNPAITVTQEAISMYYGFKMEFGQALPSGIIVRTFNTGELVEEYEVEDEVTKSMIILHTFNDFDTMQVEFTGTIEPYNRIVLNHFAFGEVTDFIMNKRDMTSSPTAIKQELVKEVIVPCYSYQTGNPEESLVNEDVTVTAGEKVTFYMGAASYGYRVVMNDGVVGISIVAQSNYYITAHFAVAGTYHFEVRGYRYRIVEQHATKTLNARGKTVKWENPLISNMTMAQDLCEWISDYYTAGIEYEYATRGNPEIDVNDIIFQENEFRDNMKVTVYRATINFNQSFSGKITARRVEG